jgi:hypothetical protein
MLDTIELHKEASEVEIILMGPAAPRAAYDYHQRERAGGPGRFIPTLDAVIRESLERVADARRSRRHLAVASVGHATAWSGSFAEAAKPNRSARASDTGGVPG